MAARSLSFMAVSMAVFTSTDPSGTALLNREFFQRNAGTTLRRCDAKDAEEKRKERKVGEKNKDKTDHVVLRT